MGHKKNFPHAALIDTIDALLALRLMITQHCSNGLDQDAGSGWCLRGLSEATEMSTTKIPASIISVIIFTLAPSHAFYFISRLYLRGKAPWLTREVRLRNVDNWIVRAQH